MNEKNEEQKWMDLSAFGAGGNCVGRFYRQSVSFKFFKLWTDIRPDQPNGS